MTKLMEQAIEKVSLLAEGRQNELAQMLIDVAAQDLHPYVFTDEERKGIEEGLAEMQRGEFASDADVAEMWKRFGL